MTTILTQEIDLKLNDWNATFQGNNLSLRSDDFGRKIGNFAEYVFAQKYKSAERISHIEHEADFVVKGKRVDVKATISNKPISYWNGLPVSHYSKDYNVDYYCWYHYLSPKKTLTRLGWISKENYFKVAKFKEKGSKFDHTGIVVPRDCYVISVGQLKKAGRLL
jgi:hypothetical protein